MLRRRTRPTPAHHKRLRSVLTQESVVRWHQGQLLFEGNRRGAVIDYAGIKVN